MPFWNLHISGCISLICCCSLLLLLLLLFLFTEVWSFPVNFYVFLVIFTFSKVVIYHPLNQSLTFVCPVYDWCNFLYFSFWEARQLPLLIFFYITAFLWYNSHTIQLIHLIQWFLVYSLIYVTVTTVSSRTSSSPQKETPFLSLSFPHLPFSLVLSNS